jgi:hypothetical protein
MADATRARHLEAASQMSCTTHVILSPTRNLVFRWTRAPDIVILGCVPVHSLISICLRSSLLSVPLFHLVSMHPLSYFDI